MPIGFDASSKSHTTNGSTSQASYNWTHTPSGVPDGILVFTFYLANADGNTSVTYGGVNVPVVTGARALDSATEIGDCKAWFLDGGIPTGAQSVVVNRLNNANVSWAVAISITSPSKPEVYLPGIVLLQENGAFSEQNVTDGSPGTNSMRFAGGYSGATAAPSNGVNSTALQSIVLAAQGMAAVRETTAGQGSRAVGMTSASDDRAGVHLAIRETFLPYTLGRPSPGGQRLIHQLLSM